MRWGPLLLFWYCTTILPVMGADLFLEKGTDRTVLSNRLPLLPVSDSLKMKAMTALQRGDSLIKAYRYQEAEKAFRQALPYFESIGDCYHTAFCQLWLGEALYGQGRYKKALQTGLKSEAVAIACPARDTMDFYSMILQNIGVFYSKAGDYRKQMAYYRRAFDHILQYNGRQSERGADAFYNLGMAYGRRGQWDRAIAYFDTSLQIAEVIDYPDGIASTFLSLSYAYGVKEDYARAIDYQRRALKLTTSKTETAQGWNNLGVLYSDMGDYSEALHYLGQALTLREELYGEYHDEILSTLLNIARVHFDSGEEKRAGLYIDDVLHRMEKAEHSDPYFLKVAYHYKALMLQYIQRLAEAEQYARKAVAIKTGRRGLNTSSKLVLGSVLQAQERYDEALDYVQEALMNDIDDFRPASVFENPPLHTIQNTSIVLDLLSLKAQLLQLRGKRDRSQNDLSYSLNSYLLVDSLIDYARRNYQDNTSKELLAANTRELYSGAVAAGYEIYRLSGDEAYMDLVFHYAEKTKSLLVLEKMHDLYAKSFYGIPAAVVEKERELLQNIEFYANRVRQFRDAIPVEQNKINEWENILFELRREQQALLRQIELKYPAYYDLKHDLSTATPDNIQRNLLRPNEVLLEYFLAGKSLYIFAIGKESRDFLRVTLPAPLGELVEGYRRALVRQEAAFYEKSHSLYRLLLEPVASIIEGKEIMVVPDGALGYIPFEALLAEAAPAEDFPDQRKLDYVLRNHAIRYLFSASLALERQGLESAHHSVRVLGIAPDFAGIAPEVADFSEALRPYRNEFAPLRGSEEEVRLLNRFAGDVWIGAGAQESRLKRKGDRYGLLHISTHTLIDERFPSLSKLVFAGETSGEEDGFLHAYELYNMHLPAELIVLSACNTGIGKIKEGEGIASLARAFAYAGAPNLVMSLWPVNDKTTPALMARFYEHLEAGEAKYRALQKAKLSYLEQENELLLHPYYWAPFIYTGDAAPVALQEARAFLPALPLGLLLLLSGFFFWWRRRTRSKKHQLMSSNNASAFSR